MFYKKLLLPILLVLFVFPQIAQAASLRLSPASGTYNVGQTMSVSVLVNSTDQAMNAVSGILSFSRNLLEVTSLSKGGSIMSLWVKEPSYSNSTGSINFEGVVLTPGFSGSTGNIITINFRVKDIGTAQVGFETAQVLANDGNGTDILSRYDGAEFTLTLGQVFEPPLEERDEGVLSVKEMPRDEFNPNCAFLIKVNDDSFDTNRFEISLNGASPKNFPVAKDNLYRIITDQLGDNNLTVRAVSKNGAFLEKTISFLVSSLEPPVITEFLDSNDGKAPILIKGTSQYPNSDIVITFRRAGDVVIREKVQADDDGNFEYINAHEFVNGDYVITAYVEREDGSKSSESTAVTIRISFPFMVYLGTLAINVFFASIILILIILLLFIVIAYLYYRFQAFRKKVHREADEAERSLEKGLRLLKEDVSDVVKSKKAVAELKKDIDDVGKYVGKEIDDIEKLK